MSKTQKTWLGIFLGLFIIPEALWSPIVNMLYGLAPTGNGFPKIFRNNFLLNYGNENLLKFIITIQLISLISFLILWFRSRKEINMIPFITVCIIGGACLIFTAFGFYLAVIFSPSFP